MLSWRDSVTVNLTVNVDISDHLHGMSGYFALGKAHESFPVVFSLFLK